jgi:hypothetical protein
MNVHSKEGLSSAVKSFRSLYGFNPGLKCPTAFAGVLGEVTNWLLMGKQQTGMESAFKFVQAIPSHLVGAEFTVVLTIKVDFWQVECSKLRHQV